MGADPEAGASVLDELAAVIESRRGADPKVSYVAKLFAEGREKIAGKVGEEAVETVLAAVQSKRGALVSESADAGIRPGEVFAELERRKGTSGLAEKAARGKG